jgi:hypothetical protein
MLWGVPLDVGVCEVLAEEEARSELVEEDATTLLRENICAELPLDEEAWATELEGELEDELEGDTWTMVLAEDSWVKLLEDESGAVELEDELPPTLLVEDVGSFVELRDDADAITVTVLVKTLILIILVDVTVAKSVCCIHW